MNFINRDALNRVLEPVNTARGLSNDFYTDRATFEEEKRKVFFKNWTAIGFGKDVPDPGDAMPLDFAGQPILLIRDKDGSVNVFQNVCRHRGMILVDKPGRIKGAIRCPYHSWCYGLDGALKSTPFVGGPGTNFHKDVPHEEFGLFKIRSHVWNDVVFVNISGEAPEFEESAADLIERWAEFKQPVFHGGPESSYRLDAKTNWKLAVENYCESYHLPWVHPGLNSYSRIEDHYHIESPGRFSGQGTVVYQQIKGDGGEVFCDFDKLGEKWNSGAEYIALYPNVLLGIHRDHFFAIVLIPVDHSRTIERVELYYAAEDMLGDDYAALRRKNAELWRTVFSEDIFVIEGMQRGRAGAKFDGGKFSPVMDSPTHTFHHWVASQFLD